MNSHGSPTKPPLKRLEFGAVSEKKLQNVLPTAGSSSVAPPGQPMLDQTSIWPVMGQTSPHLEYIRSVSSGRLKFSPDATFDFTADDLDDQGQIGEGAFGTVSMMKHKKSGALMAVKRIRSTVNEKEQKQLLMDLDVIMKSEKCNDIVQFYGAIFKEGDCWICMELMDTSLEKLYKLVFEKMFETMPEDIIGKVAVATLNALVYLKQRLQIIHRDVKPSNILLDRQGRIKLCDFGIAGQLVDSIAKTRDAGCRPYMAPERLNLSANSYDTRSDVWSLGITLVEVATGKFPYPAWNSVFDQLQQVVHGDPPILTPNENFSLEFVQFVNSCLIKEEAQRPKYTNLLETRFIKKYQTEPVDVATFVGRVLDAGQLMNQQKQWVTFDGNGNK